MLTGTCHFYLATSLHRHSQFKQMTTAFCGRAAFRAAAAIVALLSVTYAAEAATSKTVPVHFNIITRSGNTSLLTPQV